MGQQILVLLLIFSLGVQATSNDLSKLRSSLLELNVKIRTLEKHIGFKNAQYLMKLEEASQIDGKILEIEKLNESLRTKNDEELVKLNKVLRSLALSQVEDESLAQRQYYDLIMRRKQNLQKIKLSLDESQKLIDDQKHKLMIVQSEAQHTAQVLTQLDNKKHDLNERYVDFSTKKAVLEQSVQTQKLSHKLSALKRNQGQPETVSRFFKLPIDYHSDLKSSEKGITIHFSQSQPLKASYSGRVIYFGDLSSYGKVLMIDHGDDIKTVLLGAIESNVKKDDQVQEGQNLGFIRANKSSSSLYFEVRKGNIAQKTINWLDKKSLSKI